MPFALICSTEPAITQSLQVLLGPEWTVFTEATGAGTLRLCDEAPVDVVFLDEHLVDMALVDAVRALRERNTSATLVALALSARSGRIAAAIPAGLDEVLTKPFDREQVALLMHRVDDRLRRLSAPPVPVAPPPLAYTGRVGQADHATLVHTLRAIFRAAAHATDLGTMAQQLLDAVCELCGLNRGVVLWQGGSGQYCVLAARGVRRDRLDAVAFRERSGLLGWLRMHNQLCLNQGPAAAALPVLVTQEMRLLQAALALPLVDDGHLRGALALGNKITGAAFDASELDLIVCVAQYAATLLNNAQTQAAARAQRAQFEGVVQNLGSGVVVVDNDGRVQVVNRVAARVLDVTPEEVLGQPAHRLGSLVADLLLRTLAGEEQFSRYRVMNPATQSPIGVNTSLLRDDSGAALGAIMVCTSLAEVDVAPQVPAQDALETWHRFALAMAHAIKNPLVAIKTFAQLFPDRYADKEFREQFHPVAMREIERLNQLVEELLQYGSDEDLERERCDLVDLVSEVVSRQGTEQNGTVLVDVEPSAEPVIAFVDRDQIGEALTHVLQNAREAAGPGGHIWLRARRVQNGKVRAVLEVEDSGPGLPPDALAIACSPFYTTKEKGLGLGLALTELVARRHGGQVILGKGEHGGAKIAIELPLAEQEGA